MKPNDVSRSHARRPSAWAGFLNSDVGTVEVKGDMVEICAGTAAFLLAGSVDRTLLFGPIVWRPSDGTSARQWYFMVVGGDQTGEMRCDQLNAETEADTLALRSGVMDVLAKHPRAVCAISATNWRWRNWPKARLWTCARITSIPPCDRGQRAEWREGE